MPCESHQVLEQARDGEGPSPTQDDPTTSSQDGLIPQEENNIQEQASSSQPFEQVQEGELIGPISQEQAQTNPQEQVQVDSQAQAQVEPQVQDSPPREFVDYKGITRSIKNSKKASRIELNKILGSISKGVVTRRKMEHLAKFSKHHSFISHFEPLKVIEALQDPD